MLPEHSYPWQLRHLSCLHQQPQDGFSWLARDASLVGEAVVVLKKEGIQGWQGRGASPSGPSNTALHTEEGLARAPLRSWWRRS